MSDTVTMTLSEFLLARIAEDEAAAAHSKADATSGKTLGIPPAWLTGVADRMLAECEAKRRQIEHLIRFMEDDHAPWNEEQLQIMASVYAHHPDFREEWRP